MKISLDLHGVVSDMPGTLGKMMETLINGGAEVHVITGSRTDKAILELDELGFIKGKHYTHVIGVVDFLLSKNVKPSKRKDRYGNPLFNDMAWDSAKAMYCSENTIDLHMDDSDNYGKYFRTPYARLFTKNNHGEF